MPEDCSYETMSSESRTGIPNHLSFDYHSSLTPNSESNSISTSITQPKLEPGNPILAGNDSFSSLSESTAALNASNLNLQSATASGLPTTGLPGPGMSSFHWSSYSANYEKVI